MKGPRFYKKVDKLVDHAGHPDALEKYKRAELERRIRRHGLDPEKVFAAIDEEIEKRKGKPVPLDDEPFTDADREAVAEAREAVSLGELVSSEEIKGKLNADEK